ncbi:MAG TPA: cellulose binding domain-containing protein [Rugosimonospora sp.]|nr:cellulose binding domain-containing protein [Rugosimonospora sp.]
MTRSVRRFRLGVAATACAVGVGSLILVAQLPASAASTVAINGGSTLQTMDGFGISEAFGQANAIRNVGDATVQKQLLDMLFSPTTGAGFSIVRNLIPSDANHTMEPTAPASPAATPSYVWDGANDATDWGQLWLARQAKTYGVSTFYNDAWSAPAFMKTNNDEANGGSLCGSPGASCASGDWRQAYANYLVQHEKNWASVGLPAAYLGFANEPSFTTGYSSMLVNPAQATDFIKVLGPAVKAAGLSTKVACCDTLGWNLLPSYVSAVTADPAAAANIGLYTSHGYSNAPNSTISTGGTHAWESEWSNGSGTWNNAWDDGSATSGFSWAQNIHNGLANANLDAFFYWWGVSNTTSSNGSLIQLTGTTVTAAKRYYAFANYSRFVRPGAVRIAAATGDANLKVTAFRNTDGSVAVVVLNAGTSDTSATYTLSNAGVSSGTVTPYLTNSGSSTAAQTPLALSGGAFTATVPARSLVTYRIAGGSTPPSPSPTVAATSTPPTGSGCTASYRIVSSWTGGFQAEVTVANAGSSTLDGWTARWTLPGGQSVGQLWNGTLSTSGSGVTVTNASWNGALGAGASTTFGLIGSGPSTPTPAVSCASP